MCAAVHISASECCGVPCMPWMLCCVCRWVSHTWLGGDLVHMAVCLRMCAWECVHGMLSVCDCVIGRMWSVGCSSVHSIISSNRLV